MPEYGEWFYDRDVSAALNIRRCATGPGPRPTELCCWTDRPAMPKPGQPGQEWVKVADKALLRKWQRKLQRSSVSTAVQEAPDLDASSSYVSSGGGAGRFIGQDAQAVIASGQLTDTLVLLATSHGTNPAIWELAPATSRIALTPSPASAPPLPPQPAVFDKSASLDDEQLELVERVAARGKENSSEAATTALPAASAAVPLQQDRVLKPKAAFKPWAAAACVAIGCGVQWLVPMPEGASRASWTLLAVFCSTVAGLVLEPLPVSAWSLCCITALVATRACTFETAMAGLTNDAIWLIVISFFFAKASGSAFHRQPGGAYAFEKTGLGQRIANMMVAAVGHSTLGLAYSLAAAEVLLAPAMPSCTARAGGIFMPVIKFLSEAGNSFPGAGRRRLGAFLVHSQMQASCNIAALFMTGAAQNLLAMNIARGMGVHIPDAWGTWALGALVPGLASVLMIPLITFWLTPPEVRHTPQAPAEARARLAAQGPLSGPELVTLVTLGGAVVLWGLGEQLAFSSVVTAMMGLSTLLLAGVLSWRDCLEYTAAWDTLVWFSALVSMCSALAASGLVTRLADMVGVALAQAKLPWMASFGLLHALFFWGHYIFASQVGHVGALYGAFLAMMIAAGTPATLAALTLGYSSNLFGSLTHYASGPAAVFHGSGYTELREVLGLGALMGLRSCLVWGGLGMAWWKLLGWW
ncbi:hypothetical protein QJQ45_009417 [Haematococcus lacustris]|nr:hypothetical protein QJQ45_009417 [Haematococcus lacustris]